MGIYTIPVSYLGFRVSIIEINTRINPSLLPLKTSIASLRNPCSSYAMMSHSSLRTTESPQKARTRPESAKVKVRVPHYYHHFASLYH
jgi:hypothetical protein